LAALVESEFGQPVRLQVGGRGELTVRVDGRIIARKGPAGFPTDDELLLLVARELEPG